MYQEDVENIQSSVFKCLYSFKRKSEKRYILVQISNNFFDHLRKNLNLTGRFRDADHLINIYCIPSVLEVEPGRLSGMAIFQARVSK